MMVEAIKRDDTDLIMEFLGYGLPISRLYLEEAIKSKAKDTLEAFFINGWNINQPTGDLSTPDSRDEEMTTWLLDRGADPNGQCKVDDTPLSYAVHAGPISIIKLMFDRGGDIHRGQLLHRAIYRENDVIEVLTMLLQKGAPLNAIMYQDHEFSQVILDCLGPGTALHRAAELGKVDVVRYLLSCGADTTVLDTKGRTALERAESQNQAEVVEMLKAAAN
ncbi:Ankyrin repeat protein [Penicillium riverlandense]|uniref:Ankyrin repeat protein n=1 Tax=Penicillium riverlandense TaxID=1903569 RepID=UPI002548A8F6|nr:Ankyrin repeat protein [Penicillium riverlandense]KAJ5814871.1 Ankyrin repeat protein [Penicillium riverlandense]